MEFLQRSGGEVEIASRRAAAGVLGSALGGAYKYSTCECLRKTKRKKKRVCVVVATGGGAGGGSGGSDYARTPSSLL